MAAMLRLHPCPLLFSPPPPHPHLRRQLAVYSIPKSPFQSAAAAARARNPPRLAAVGGEQRRRVGDDYDEEEEDLGQALERTRQLVECAMFASVAGLAYFLSNSLAIENYFSCFFPLPIVISSLRWGLEAGRKTAVQALAGIMVDVVDLEQQATSSIAGDEDAGWNERRAKKLICVISQNGILCYF